MNDRDRLIEIIYCAGRDYDDYVDAQHEIGMSAYEDFDIWLADDLLANGVIVLPCYIGQEVWYLSEHFNGSVEIEKGKISMLQQKADKSWKFRISHNSSVWDFKTEDIGVKYFTTKEEAEEKLKEF